MGLRWGDRAEPLSDPKALLSYQIPGCCLRFPEGQVLTNPVSRFSVSSPGDPFYDND